VSLPFFSSSVLFLLFDEPGTSTCAAQRALNSGQHVVHKPLSPIRLGLAERRGPVSTTSIAARQKRARRTSRERLQWPDQKPPCRSSSPPRLFLLCGLIRKLPTSVHLSLVRYRTLVHRPRCVPLCLPTRRSFTTSTMRQRARVPGSRTTPSGRSERV